MRISDLLAKVRLIGDKAPKPLTDGPGDDEPPAGKAKAAGK
jgi:hypothetical protein